MLAEKEVKDIVRIELACLLSLARDGHTDFLQDIMDKASPSQRSIIKKELKAIEQMLRTKCEAVDEA